MVQYSSFVIELIGLVLVAIELYFPAASEFLKATFEETKPKVMKNKYAWLGGFILVWVVAVFGLSFWEESLLLISNLFFSAITALVLLVLSISKLLVRLGVVLGRGNSVGGVGLVLAVIGLSLELVQLL